MSAVVTDASIPKEKSKSQKEMNENQRMNDFVQHLKNGFLITKLPQSKLKSPTRRVLYADATGTTINWRAANKNDFPSEVEYMADRSKVSYEESKSKSPIPLHALKSVQFSTDKIEKPEPEYFARLVFENYRSLDIELLTKDDFEYCMDGFELIADKRADFKSKYEALSSEMKAHANKKSSSELDSWDEDAMYKPLVFHYGDNKVCNLGCGNDVEDILLISSCYGCLYSFLVAFFSLLLKGTLDSDEKSTILFLFLGFFVLFTFFASIAVQTGQSEIERNKALKIKLGLEYDAKMPVAADEE